MKFIENFTYDGDVHSVMNIPGLEENAIMIDSLKIQYVWCKNWLYCFKKTKS
jgi:aspartate aminotransferase